MINAIKIYVLGTLACLTILCTVWCLSTLSETKAGTVAHRDNFVTRAIYQQDVDHFSNDARAMSPRDWGSIERYTEPESPQVEFDHQQSALSPPPLDERSQESQFVELQAQNEFRSVEYGTVRRPAKFYENQPLEIRPSDPPGLNSSPLPLQTNEVETSSQKEPTESQEVQRSERKQRAESKPTDERPLESRMEKYEGPAYSQGLSSEEADNRRLKAVEPTYDQLVFGNNLPNGHDGTLRTNTDCDCPSCSLPPSFQMEMNGCTADRPGLKHRMQQRRVTRKSRLCRDSTRNLPFARNLECGPETVHDPSSDICCENRDGPPGIACGSALNNFNSHCDSDCAAGYGNQSPVMHFNPALGFREDFVGQRFHESSAEEFPFEEYDQYPSMREILAQSIYFVEAEFMFLQPAFGGNTAISSGAAGSFVADPFNFDLEPAFRVTAGYESEFGPGFAGEYFQFDNNSDVASFTSDGVQVGETSVYQLGPNAWTRLTAANAGETINAFHSLEVHSTSISAFKALKFKRALVNGRFGLQITTINQKLQANLLNGGGALLAQLRNDFEVNAFGPRFGIDYIRRVGHTRLQLVSSATGALLFGDRDQLVSNSLTGETSSVGADEFITHLDIFLGLQSKRFRGEKRNTTMRLGFVNQSWIGGGTAIDPNDDFGFQGISLAIGINR